MKTMRTILSTYCVLFLVLFIAVFLRFIKLGETPISLDWDEAALGYNAYSILKTGRDEYGTWFPLVLRSFDDYKPPLYAYLTIPSVAIFGLTEWAVRLPSAVMGVLAVIGVYVLTRKLLKDAYSFRIGRISIKLSDVTSFLFAISPWNIQFSRIAFEANIGITLNIWVVIFFLYGIRHGKFLVMSAVFAGMAMYAYHSERIFLPLLLIILALVHAKRLLSDKKWTVTAGIIGILLVVPLMWTLRNPATWMRLRGTSSLSDEVNLLSRSVTKLEHDKASGNIFGLLYDNRRIVWAQTIAEGYLSHFSLRWLFLTGDNDRHHAPDMGLLYIWELPFLFWGMYEVARRKDRLAVILFGWFFISPIPASVTSEVPHAIRSMVFLPTFQIFIGVGVVRFLQLIVPVIQQKKSRWKSLAGIGTTLVLSAVIGFNFLYYLSLYFIHMNREFSRFWQYGYKEAVEYVQKRRGQFTKVVVSPKLEQPHMFFLFFTKYDPKKYLAEGGTRSGGFEENMNRFDIFEFRPLHWDSEIHDGKTLYIGTPIEISGTPMHVIRYLDSSEAIKIAE